MAARWRRIDGTASERRRIIRCMPWVLGVVAALACANALIGGNIPHCSPTGACTRGVQMPPYAYSPGGGGLCPSAGGPLVLPPPCPPSGPPEMPQPDSSPDTSPPFGDTEPWYIDGMAFEVSGGGGGKGMVQRLAARGESPS